MAGEYNLTHVLRILYAWRKRFLWVLAVVGIVTIVILLLLPNYYRAQTTFYAASEDLFKPQKIFGTGNGEMYFYGSSDDINRLLTIGASNDFLDTLITLFDLYNVYKIDSTDEQAEYKVRKVFFKHYDILRTKYDAIEISVEDTDPVRAAEMANTSRHHIQERAARMIKDSQKKLIDSYARSISEKEKLLKTLGDSLANYQYAVGIYDPEAQAEYLSTQVVELESKRIKTVAELESFRKASAFSGKRDTIAKLEATIQGIDAVLEILNNPEGTAKLNLKQFSQARSNVSVMNDAYAKAINQMSLDKENLKKYQSAYEMDVPVIHILSEAEVPVKKHKPRRTLILLTVIAVTAIFCIVAILLLESSKQIEWRSIPGRVDSTKSTSVKDQ